MLFLLKYKTSELSFKKVQMLLERYSCPICRKNNHAFHTCNALKGTYNVSLRNTSSHTNNTSSSNLNSSATATTQPTVAANCVSTSVQVLPGVVECYNGFESVAILPPESDSDNGNNDVQNIQESLNLSINH